MKNKVSSQNFAHLVGLYTYHKKMHGAYNVKLNLTLYVSCIMLQCVDKLYVPCIMFQCVDKPTRCNAPYEWSLLSINWLYMFWTITSPSSGTPSNLFVIIAWIIIHFCRNPKSGGSPPRENNDVNIMNFIRVASLFVIIVLLMNDTPDRLMADTTVSASVE